MNRRLIEKILIFLVAITVFSSSLLPAFALLNSQEAEEIALSDIGIKRNNAMKIISSADMDDGVLEGYDVKVYVKTEKGYTEYEYEIGTDGDILERDVEYKIIPDADNQKIGTAENQIQPAEKSTDIGSEKAVAIAIESYTGAEKPKLLTVERDSEDGNEIYEVELRDGLRSHMSCDIDAFTGEITDSETEYCNKLGEKLDLAFDIVEAWFHNLFCRKK